MSAHFSKDDASGLVLLEASDPSRRAAESHAAECPTCRLEWSRAERLLLLVSSLAPAPAPAAAVLQRARARVHAELASAPHAADPEPEVAKPGWATGAATVLAGLLGFSLLRHDASTLRYALAGLAIGVAALLASLAARSPRDARRATAAALGLSVALGAVDLRVFAMDLGHAQACFSTHIVAALLPLGAALWLVRSRRGSASPFHASAAAAAGALAGQAVLLTACSSEESFLHMVFFHVSGVAAAATIGAGSGRVVASLRA